MKQKICFIATTLISLLLLLVAFFTVFLDFWRALPDLSDDYIRADVLEILAVKTDDYGSGLTDQYIAFKAKLKSGPYKGTTVTAVQNINSYQSLETKTVEIGDKVILSFLRDGSPEDEWFFAEYLRSDVLVFLAVLFFAVLLFFGRIKGVKTAISLLFTVAAVFFAFIPAVMTGQNVYLWTALLGIFITVMTTLLVNGWSWLTLSSSLGCLAGISLSAIVLVISEYFLRLSGNIDEHSVYLFDMGVDLHGILYAAIVIGAIGAIMDVAVNISASLHELACKVEASTFASLLKSGFTIGRDILGTMTNTLILAYVGSSLCSLLLILYSNATSPLLLFNREVIISELLQILVGSLALLLTIPASAFISAFLYSKPRFLENIRKENEGIVAEDDYADTLNALNEQERSKEKTPNEDSHDTP